MTRRFAAAVLLLLALPFPACAQSDMPYAGAPCTAAGGIKPSAAQVANFKRFDSALRAALRQNNVAALAFLISFPLRVNTGKGTLMIPDAQSLSGHYAEIFPQRVRDAVLATKDDDYICKYDEGLGYMNGWLWVSTNKGKFTVDTVNAGGERPNTGKLALAYTCETRTHRIVIDESADGNDVRFRSWNKPRPVTAAPDVDLSKGEKTYEGTGVCAYPLYTFKTQNVVYEVQSEMGCTEGSEPKKATGHLSVTIGDKQVTDDWCF